MFCQDFMFVRTYYFGQTLVFSKMLLFLWVWDKIPQPEWPHGPWDHFMVLVKNRLCIDILHSDTTFCEWPLFSIFLCNCMKKLCQCIRQHASCVKIRSMFSSKTIRSLWGALGSFWGALFYNLVKKWTFQFRAFGSQVRSLPSKNDLPELIPGDPRGSPGIPGDPRMRTKWHLARSSQPPFTRAGGQDDVSS